MQLTLRDSGLLTPPANETKQYARSRDHCGRGAKKNKMKKKKIHFTKSACQQFRVPVFKASQLS